MAEPRSTLEAYASSLEGHVAGNLRPFAVAMLAHTGTSSVERFGRVIAAEEALAKLLQDARRCAALFDEINEPYPALLRRFVGALR